MSVSAPRLQVLQPAGDPPTCAELLDGSDHGWAARTRTSEAGTWKWNTERSAGIAAHTAPERTAARTARPRTLPRLVGLCAVESGQSALCVLYSRLQPSPNIPGARHCNDASFHALVRLACARPPSDEPPSDEVIRERVMRLVNETVKLAAAWRLAHVCGACRKLRVADTCG